MDSTLLAENRSVSACDDPRGLQKTYLITPCVEEAPNRGGIHIVSSGDIGLCLFLALMRKLAGAAETHATAFELTPFSASMWRMLSRSRAERAK